jgi:hypothetical protein
MFASGKPVNCVSSLKFAFSSSSCSRFRFNIGLSCSLGKRKMWTVAAAATRVDITYSFSSAAAAAAVEGDSVIRTNTGIRSRRSRERSICPLHFGGEREKEGRRRRPIYSRFPSFFLRRGRRPLTPRWRQQWRWGRGLRFHWRAGARERGRERASSRALTSASGWPPPLPSPPPLSCRTNSITMQATSCCIRRARRRSRRSRRPPLRSKCFSFSTV